MIALGVIAAVWLFGRRLEERAHRQARGRQRDRRCGRCSPASSAPASTTSSPTGSASRTTSATSRRSGRAASASRAGCSPASWSACGWPSGTACRSADAATCAAPAIPLAQAIGRWGNWFNQELYGRPTDLPWALEIDADHLPNGGGYDVGHDVPPDVPLRVAVELRCSAACCCGSTGSGRSPAAAARGLRPRLRRRPALGRGPAHRPRRRDRRAALEPVDGDRGDRRRRRRTSSGWPDREASLGVATLPLSCRTTSLTKSA